MMRFLFLLSASLAFAVPRDLIALADGNTVYFRTRTGIVTDSWFKLTRNPDGGVIVVPARAPLVDVSDTGTMEASSQFATNKVCGVAGSTCSLAPSCAGAFNVSMPGEPAVGGGRGRDTFIRLDGSGRRAWIEQRVGCTGLGIPQEPALATGLYDAATLAPVTGSTVPAGFTLANRAVGRRMVLESRRALLRNAVGRLQWWSPAGGSEAVQHRDPSIEAVTDAAGCQVVYRTAASTRWLDCGNPGADEDLGFASAKAALSSDGRVYAYVNEASELAVYDRATRNSVTGLLPPGNVESLAIGGERSLFVSTIGNGLLHMDLYSGEVATLLPDLPELSSVVAAQAPVSLSCPLVCYGAIEPLFLVSPGMRLMTGPILPAAWTWSIAGSVSPQESLQVPYGLTGRQTLRVTRPDVPGIALQMGVWVQPQQVTCLGSTHLNPVRPVTFDDPAAVDETIRMRMTGLKGVTEVPFQEPNPEGVGVANPPALAEPVAAEVLGFALSPGEIGVQYVDLKILRRFTQSQLFDPRVPQYQCAVPPVR